MKHFLTLVLLMLFAATSAFGFYLLDNQPVGLQLSDVCAPAGLPMSEAGPTAEEQAVLDELNFVRTNPQGYAQTVLVPFLESIDADGTYHIYGKWFTTHEGQAAVREAINVLNNTTPIQALTFDAELREASTAHNNDIGPLALVSHDSSDGTKFHQRIKKYKSNCPPCAECISYGWNFARDIVRQLIVDDNVPNRGHRNIILDPKLRLAGPAIGTHAKWNHMCTIDFCY